MIEMFVHRATLLKDESDTSKDGMVFFSVVLCCCVVLSLSCFILCDAITLCSRYKSPFCTMENTL